MRPNAIAAALGLIGVGITIAMYVLPAMKVELSPLTLHILLGIAGACFVFALGLFIYGFLPPRVEGGLSRKAIRQLTALRIEIHSLVRTFKRWEELGPAVPILEQAAAFEVTLDRLVQWTQSVRRWCLDHRPQAVVFLSTCAESTANLLAECYAENIDRLHSEVIGERATGPAGRLNVVLNKLGELHHRGLYVANGLSHGYLTMSLDLRQNIHAWSNEVELYLQDHQDLGLSYSSRFINNALFPGGVSLSDENVATCRQAWERAVRRRCDNLNALIGVLQQRRGAL